MKKWAPSTLYLIFSSTVCIILFYVTIHAVNSFQHDYSVYKRSVLSRSGISAIDGNSDFNYVQALFLTKNVPIGNGNEEAGDFSEESDFDHYEVSDEDDDEDDEIDDEGDDVIANTTAFQDDRSVADSPIVDSPSIVATTVKDTIQAIVEQVLAQRALAAKRIKWVQDRLEVTVTCPPPSSVDLSAPPPQPSIDELNAAHRAIYEALETQTPLAAFLETCEILVSSPGVSDELVYDRDFISFKGFPVSVTMSEPHKKQMQFDGTLHSRDAEYVTLTLKGRLLRLPRSQVLRVALPPSRFEATDEQIRKLR